MNPAKANICGRSDALRKLLALGPLYRDEIYSIMGGDRQSVTEAIAQLETAGKVDPVKSIRQAYKLRVCGKIKMPSTAFKTVPAGNLWGQA